MQKPGESPGNYGEWKKLIPKSYMLCDAIYVHS